MSYYTWRAAYSNTWVPPLKVILSWGNATATLHFDELTGDEAKDLAARLVEAASACERGAEAVKQEEAERRGY